MKISQIFLCVIGLHLAVIAFLFATPGCQSGPEAETTGSEGIVGPPEDTLPSEANENYRQGEYTVGGVPVKSEGSTGPTTPRYAPTRPSWNLNQEQPAEVIEGTEVEVIEPVTESSVPSMGPTTAQTSSYTVKKGDNLTVIARRHDVSLSELMNANGLDKNSILKIGQVLVIPAPSYEPPAGELSAGAGTSAEVEGKNYTVKPGDSLSVLARRNGTTVSAIKGANGLTSNTIYVGQTLLIPADGVSYTAPASGSSSAPLPEGTYQVKKGDTLGAIAKRYDVKVSAIMTANGITDPRSLRAGQKIVIPGVGSNPPASAPSTPAPAAAPVAAPVPAPSSPPATVEQYDADILLENLDDIPAAEVQSTN